MNLETQKVEEKIMKTYDELKTQRTSAKANMTRIKNYITANINTISSVELECRFNIFEQYWRMWLSHQNQMEKLKPDETSHQSSRGEAEDLYCETKILYSTNKAPSSISEGNISMALSTPLKANIPPMKLPMFSGKYSDYPNFIAIFNKLVGDDDSLTVTEKYNHLRHCLTGPALKTIDALGKSADNYVAAIATLKTRYDNKCLIFQEHISQMMELPKISKNSGNQLRNLIDNISSHINAMKTIGSEADIMNSMIIYLVTSKLDQESRNKYEDTFEYDCLPKWSDMYTILSKRCQLLEVRECKTNKPPHALISVQNNHTKKKNNHSTYSLLTTASAETNSSCLLCSAPNHKIDKCPEFEKLSILDRFQKAKQLSLCINCLRNNHVLKRCKSSTCKVCSKKHHTLLHRYESSKPDTIQQPSPNQIKNPYSGYAGHDHSIAGPSNIAGASYISTSLDQKDNNYLSGTASFNSPNTNQDHVFLATAVVHIKDNTGTFRLARALLDSGSQLNFITEHLVQNLKVKKTKIKGEVGGIGQSSSIVKNSTEIMVKSRVNEFQTNINCWILPSITNHHPQRNINQTELQIPSNIELADPLFFKPQKIDLLIGAEKFFELLSVGQIKLKQNGPTLQKTIFGWVVSGHFQPSNVDRKQLCITATSKAKELKCTNCDEELNNILEKFWQIESVDSTYCKFNEEQQFCETLFEKTICRMKNNRLMVKLPFKKSTDELGDSYNKAKARFVWLEKKLNKDPQVKQQYSDFMSEYLELNHMQEIKWNDIPRKHYFIPHQYVVRPESSTTKFRVVFNASCVTSSNVSLNDILAIGPTVQNDIFSILFKFRLYYYALTADVSKMYRQIWVYPEDRNFQLILWRNKPTENLKIFRLNTLTYGTASAPYLATRSLNYLADQHLHEFPLVAEMIKNSIYVDDFIAGADTVAELYKIQSQIITIFRSANLNLRKWYSNEESILQQIAKEDLEKPLQLYDLDIIRTLGMIWDPKNDQFCFNYSDNNNIKSAKITKRSVLSDLAKLFDPLGLINPIIVTSKLFMQELWLLKLAWDESLPQHLHDRWVNFKNTITEIKYIKIPRFVLSHNSITLTQIHGFCDSSVKAYGACIYVRTVDIFGNMLVNLLCAKSKVASSKNTRTLPELELLGAELLAKLWRKIKNHYRKEINDIYFWTDSTIVLGWLSSHASKWQIFVANRISRIQEQTSEVNWRHVTSKSNPADIVSRGCTVTELQNSIWFTGPDFLYKPADKWPVHKTNISLNELPKLRKASKHLPTTLVTINHIPTILDFIYKSSNFKKIRRIFAYVNRFVNNTKRKEFNEGLKSSTQSRQLNTLTADELNKSFLTIIYLIQRHEFKTDIQHLNNNQAVHHSSVLKNLNPFIDCTDNLLRVGGRLRNANLPYNARCPILLPKNNQFINSYIFHLHFSHCHAGAQALMCIMSQQFWIIGAREYVRRVVRSCIHCFRYRPKLLKQIMGDLPADRVNIGLAFSISGVDFCGPIFTSPTIRGHKTYKTYIAVFVCFISKGVHLEIVTDLSANAFIAALKRFVSRRMLCKKLYCDNATNFVGAKRHLTELRNQFLKQSVQSEIASWCAENSIQFEHIPPRSPHFGGIWEAAVKSAKSLLYPTIQHAHLSYECLSTVCCQIESILNSRPITQSSTDPNDEGALTPAHFWNQAPVEIFVEPELSASNLTYLSKWQRISAVQQHFWKRWSNEYITSLQKRSKWQNQSANLVRGKLVLVHEENLPPQKWLLGRIVHTITGNDNKIRVADIKTKNGILRRSIHKLALLPIDVEH